MSKATERILLLFSDLICINLAWYVYYFIRVDLGWIKYSNPPSFIAPMVAIYFYWLIIFTLSGLYEHWFARSRFDEFSRLIKVVSIGCIILFFAIFLDDFVNKAPVISRFLIVIYWFLLITIAGTGRIVIRSFQKSLLSKGYGLKNSLIVGTGKKAHELYDMISEMPELGYKVVGFISENGRVKEGTLGGIPNLPELVNERKVTEILVALETPDKEELYQVLRYSSAENVKTKIMPDMYDIVSGMAKTNQIYGVPLIDVASVIMPAPSLWLKRLIDILISSLVLILTLPVTLIAVILVKLTSKGPAMYSQVRVGKNGKEFTIHKLRTMYQDAEAAGPQWSHGKDPRITKVGRVLRRTRIDELPQMINVLNNDMSIVGPRPERPYFVKKLVEEIPYYSRRMLVKPGITGWAQIKHKYDESIDDVKTKLQYDFYYIENMSIKLDLKIMLNTIFVMLKMKGV